MTKSKPKPGVLPPPPKPEYQPDDELNVQQAAYHLGIGRTTLSRLLAEGAIKHTRLSERNIRIRVRDLDAYKARQTTGGESPS